MNDRCEAYWGAAKAVAKRFGSLANVVLNRGMFALTKNCRMITTPEGFKLSHPNAIISYWDIFIERNLDGPWLLGVETAVDVGYAWGIFTRRLLCFSPGAVVCAFEPNRISFDVAERLYRVHLSRAAIAHMDEKNRQYYTHQCGGSLVPNATHDGVESVATSTLDKALSHKFGRQGNQVDLLKVDIDGGELQLLAGAQETLKKTKWLLIEYLGDIEDVIKRIPKPKEVVKLRYHNYAIKL